MNKVDIKNLALSELKEALVEMGEPPFRAEQIFHWLYQKGVDNFTEMKNLIPQLINKLTQAYYIGAIKLTQHLQALDGTEKFLFQLSDGQFIETVLIYAQHRKTVCLSTQVGCRFACAFCASGLNGFSRNLLPSEITNQILFLQHCLKHKITNYVFMGMGEPLDNLENVAKAIMIMNDSKAMGIGARKITISTCGIIPGIKKLKHLGLQINLSISLHAANNQLRTALMPINRRYPLEKLIAACTDSIRGSARMLTLEYILIKDENDSLKDADQLAGIAKRLRAKVNLLTLSPIPDLCFRASPKTQFNIFMQRLMEQSINVTIRESKGRDIQAACGQLAGNTQLSAISSQPSAESR